MNKFDIQNISQFQDSFNVNTTPLDLTAFQRYADEQLNDLDNISLSPNKKLMNENIRHKSKSVVPKLSQSVQMAMASPAPSIMNNRVTYGV